MTPRLTSRICAARGRALDRENDRAISIAYNVEAFARTKKLPPLETLLSKRKRSSRVMSPEAQWALMTGLAAGTKAKR